MTTEQFCLPDVGEGLTEAEIVTWHVAVGDTVAQNQVLVEIETAKSLVELPSPFAGTVTGLLVEEGQTVAVGTPIVTIGSSAGEPAPSPPDPPDSPEPRPSVLVGYGPSASRVTRRRRRPPNGAAVPVAGAAAAGAMVVDGTAAPARVPVRTKPPVRKLAKDLGIDLTTVVGSGPHDTITRDDVLRHADATAAPPSPPPAAAAGPAPTTRIPVKGVRKATAAAMTASAFTAPHVTEFLTVDVTRAVRLVDKLKADPAFAGSRVTMLLLVARALLAAVRQHPEINASWDDQAQEIVLYHQVNLGIAAATPRGLMVPNIKNAGALSLPGLAAALTALVETARDGKSTPADLARGTITITNVGVFGVDAGTPILNPGEAAILCVGAVRQTPWAHKGKVALRWTTQLALSFDHRLVDGELGSTVLARIGRILENPKWELLLS
jgi:2-oxoisovalerate dehydrogenase E2 component (dihydrolipoyl transacylase)